MATKTSSKTKAKTKPKKKVMSGHCSVKHCEGTKPKSYSGIPFPVCLDYESCLCKCHTEITSMYEEFGMDRPLPEQNPEYRHWAAEQRTLFVMPSMADIRAARALSNPGGGIPPDDDEGSHTGTSRPAFAPTPTGRRARGQLEYDVLAVCSDFVNEVFDWDYCTPKNVAEEIGKRKAVEPPSTGAINAVWDRWVKLGFIEQAKKPSRFLKFVGDSSEDSLEMIKAKAKRDKKRNASAARRGVRQ